MPDEVAIPLVIAICAVVFIPLLVGLVLVIRDTVRKKGRWGINTNQVYCPRCGEWAPAVRAPRNLRQMLWGGWTCERCGQEFDKWGEPVGDAPPPEDRPDDHAPDPDR